MGLLHSEFSPFDVVTPMGITADEIFDGSTVTVRSGDTIGFAFSFPFPYVFFLDLQYTSTSPTVVTITFIDKTTVTKKVSLTKMFWYFCFMCITILH